MAYTKYSLTPANNNAAPPDGAPEGMLPSAVNDTMRDMMAQIRDCGDGIRGGTYTMTAPVITGGSISGITSLSTTGNTTLGDASTDTLNVGNGGLVKDASGNVGVGTASPITGLSVNKSTGYIQLTDGTIDYRSFVWTGNSAAAIGTWSNHSLLFNTNNVERLRIDTSGNVGIGTASPGRPLSISYAGDNIASFATSGNEANIQISCSSSTGRSYEIISGGAGGAFAGGLFGIYDRTATAVRFVINSSGNIGIGTSSPSAKLNIVGGGTSALIVAGGSGSTIRNTASSGSSWFAATNVDSYILHNESNTPMLFTTNGTERMRVASTGELLINTTDTTLYNNTSGYGVCYRTNASLDVLSTNDNCIILNRTGTDGGILEFRKGGTTVGNVAITGSATTYNTSSDYRLKDNVAPMQNALDVVQKLKPVTYTWKVDGSSSQGFIAHELQAVVPECVSGKKDGMKLEKYQISPAIPATYDEDGNELTPAVKEVIGEREVPAYQGIDTSFLVAALTKAIQEQQIMIEELKAKVAALEAA